jgi:CspA family cold shock protein
MKKTGYVSWFNKTLGYGFIYVEDLTYPDAFFHFSDLEMEGFKKINRGQHVIFTLEMTRKGPYATKIKPL